MLKDPRQLAGQFEKGEIDRQEFQSLMAIHARTLLAEVELVHRNPFAAWLETRKIKSSLKKLQKKHSPKFIREILIALSHSENFIAAGLLWNADHLDVPLYCFFRLEREPLLWISKITNQTSTVEITVEAMEPGNLFEVSFKRRPDWTLEVSSISKA